MEPLQDVAVLSTVYGCLMLKWAFLTPSSKLNAFSSPHSKSYIWPGDPFPSFSLFYLFRNLSVNVYWIYTLVAFSVTEYQYYPAFPFLCFVSVLNSLEGSKFLKGHVFHVVCCICKFLPCFTFLVVCSLLQGYVLFGWMHAANEMYQATFKLCSHKVNSPCVEGHLNSETQGHELQRRPAAWRSDLFL